jgi:hypothetical protein
MNWIRRHLDFGLLVLVIALATILRLWNFWEIPFTYDEYSSFFRASQSSYSQVLEVGILTDAHPAFLHSFLYLWLKVVGDSVFLVKLPFIIASIAAVWLTYLLGKRWFGVHAGLLAAALLSVAEFPLMYSQIARPYSIGLFAAMGMLWQWDNFIRTPNRKSAIWLAITFAGGAYIHHFLALHGLVLLVLAFFMLPVTAKKNLVYTAIVGLLAYLPQLWITLEQLKFKGIGSILPPVDLSFIAHHLGYIANFDWIFGLLLLFILGTSLAHWKKIDASRSWTLAVIWVTPLAIGLIYSFAIAPIIQDRVLIFALPALFILMAAGLQWVNPNVGRTLVVLTCLVGVFSTAGNRDYYELFYHDDHTEVAKCAFAIDSVGPSTKLLAYHPPILDFQAKKQGFLTQEVVNPDSSWTMRDYRELILEDQGRDFIFGWTTQYYLPPFEIMAILRERFKSLKLRWSFNHGDFQCWSDVGDTYRSAYSNSMSLASPQEGWSYSQEKVVHDSLQDYLHMSQADEWGLLFSAALDTLKCHRNAVITASIEVNSLCQEALLVMEIVGPCGQMSWRSKRFSEFLVSDEKGMVHISTPLSEMGDLPDGATLRTFVWNQGSCAIQLFSAEVWIDDGLKLMYALDHPLR